MPNRESRPAQTIRDADVRKTVEAYLTQTEDRYRNLLEAAPDAMVVVNEEGEIVLLNLQAEKQFGYPRDELLGQKVTNIIPQGFAEGVIADSTRTAAEALAQQIGTGIELTARRKDGSAFPVEIMLSPLENDEGTLVTAAIRDISVRKVAEVHLAQMEGRYRGLLEAAPDAMVVVNDEGEIVLLDLQAEQQFGYPRDELLGQKVTNIIPEGFAERLISDRTRTAAEALAQQIGTGIELTARCKNGRAFPVEIMLSPLENSRRHPWRPRRSATSACARRPRCIWRKWRAAIAGSSKRRRTRWSWSMRRATSSFSIFRPRSSSAIPAMSCSDRRSPTSFRRASPSG